MMIDSGMPARRMSVAAMCRRSWGVIPPSRLPMKPARSQAVRHAFSQRARTDAGMVGERA